MKTQEQTQEQVVDIRLAVLNKMLGGRIDSYGFAPCPGRSLHNTKTGTRDFRVFGIKGKMPRGSCFHSTCSAEVDRFNEELASELVLAGGHYWPWPDEEESNGTGVRRRKRVPADAKAIAAIAGATAPEVTLEWLEKSSPHTPRIGPHEFLTLLYPNPEDRILLFKDEASQGQLVWSPDTDPTWENNFLHCAQRGVWFLVQPVTGQFTTLNRLRTPHNPTGRTRRAAECVTHFRYLVLESDNVDPESWVKVLVNLPMPIVSVTGSGSRSLHALVRVDAANQMEWETYRHDIEGAVSTLGCDPGALKAVQLSRLPGCLRHTKFDKESDSFVHFNDGPHLQKLYYINPAAKGTDTIWARHKH